MKIHVATFATVDDLDDLRDSVRDADLEFICSYPTTCARTRSDVLVGALAAMRSEYVDLADLDDDQTTPLAMPNDVQLAAADDDPENAATYNVYQCGQFYGIIRVNVFEI